MNKITILYVNLELKGMDFGNSRLKLQNETTI